ncbi:hypothetical protein D3C81_594700 [compost metagenome]
MDDQQRARELLAAEWRRLNEDAPADMLEAGCELPPLVAAAVAAISAALRAAPEVEVIGEAWRLVDSDGGQFGELYNSEWDASVAQVKWPGDRTGAPFTVQRLELIAARPQGVKDGK